MSNINSYAKLIAANNNPHINTKSGQQINKPHTNQKSYGTYNSSPLMKNKPDDVYTFVTDHMKNQPVVPSVLKMYDEMYDEMLNSKNRKGGKSRKTKQYTKKRKTKKSRRKG